MTQRMLWAALLLMTPVSGAMAQPLADHHRHLFSPAPAALISPAPPAEPAPAIFLNQILPEAPNVPVQIAHLAGAGGYEVPIGDQALAVFVEAIAANDPRTANLWFDVTAVATAKTTPERAETIAQRIRQLGVRRILYGTDAPTGTNLPKNGWAAFRALPLTEAEFKTIADNVPPYMR